MKRLVTLFLGTVLALSGTLAVGAQDLDSNAALSTVFVALYDAKGDFVGWGSGFYVDEGIVVTNKHVVSGGKYFKVFATGADGKVDQTCGKVVSLSDVKINLNDDAAYIRTYLPCAHGVVQFVEEDIAQGEPVSVMGYPDRGSQETLTLSITKGSVTGKTAEGWLSTDAYIHFGNSGGPVIHQGKVVGVAVAKRVDADGNYVSGYFVPGSVALKGLLDANNSNFGYTPQKLQNNAAYSSSSSPYGKKDDSFNPLRQSPIATNGDCRQSLGEGGQSTGYGGCECKGSYHPDDAGKTCLPGAPVQKGSSSRSSSSSSRSSSSSKSSTSSTSSSSVRPAPKKKLTAREKIALRKAQRRARALSR